MTFILDAMLHPR